VKVTVHIYISRDKGTVVPQRAMKPYDRLEVEFLSFLNEALTLNTNHFTPVKNPLVPILYEAVWTTESLCEL